VAGPVDDDLISEARNENAIREVLLGFIECSGFPMPSGRIPHSRIAEGLRRIGGNIRDLVQFVKIYNGRLTNGPPATWSHVVAAFERWTTDPKTVDDIRRRLDFQIAQERRDAADAETGRVMDPPTDPESALVATSLSIQIAGPQVPKVVHQRLVRSRELESPAAVPAMTNARGQCPRCNESGVLGDALTKTLRFCECPAGEERRRCDGADYPAQEIIRVHTSIQSQLVAAARSCNLQFAADAIENSMITDDGQVLTVRVDEAYRLSLTPEDLKRALEILGERRTLRTTGLGGVQPAPYRESLSGLARKAAQA
jgi:hypothetical protein